MVVLVNNDFVGKKLPAIVGFADFHTQQSYPSPVLRACASLILSLTRVFPFLLLINLASKGHNLITWSIIPSNPALGVSLEGKNKGILYPVHSLLFLYQHLLLFFYPLFPPSFFPKIILNPFNSKCLNFSPLTLLCCDVDFPYLEDKRKEEENTHKHQNEVTVSRMVGTGLAHDAQGSGGD